MLLDMLLFGALIPGAAAGLLALLLARAAEPGQHVRKTGSAVVGGGFAIAFAAYFGVHDLFAPSSWHWVFWTAVAAMPMGLLASSRRPLLPIASAAVALAAIVHVMLRKLVPHELGAGEVWAWACGLGGVGAILIAGLEASSRAIPAKRLLPAWMLYASAFAGLVFELGSARLGQMAGFVAAGAGALLVMAWLFPKRSALPAASFPFLMTLLAIGTNTYFFGYDVPGLPLILAALPPLLFGIASRWKWLREGKALPAGALLAALAVLPVACAYAISLMGAEADPYGGDALPY